MNQPATDQLARAVPRVPTGGPLDLLSPPAGRGSGHDRAAGGLRIAVVGAGICGLCAAITLAERGHRVTIFERDTAPPALPLDAQPASVNAYAIDEAFFAWPRPGAAQFRHPHAFLGLVCNLLAERYPILLQQLFKAGARRLDFKDMLPPALRDDYLAQPGDAALWVLLCRRAAMETVIRSYALSSSGVDIVNEARVLDLLTDTAADQHAAAGSLPVVARGLRVRHADGSEQDVVADLVIDASGRRSRFPGFLKARGATVPEHREDAEIVYYTRHYRLRADQSEPPRGRLAGAGDLGYLKFGVFPGDNGHFAIILCVPVAEKVLKRALRDGQHFDQICRAIPGLEPWLAPGRSEATTKPIGIGDIQAVWRDYVVAGQPLALNFFAVGDAHVRTNPLYGRGCSTGVMHAALLADVIAEHQQPAARAVAFEALTLQGLRPIYDASLAEDRRGRKRAVATREGRALDRAGSLKRYLALALGDALAAAATREPEVVRGLMRTVNLLEVPGRFLQDPAIKRTIFRYMLRGRRRNSALRLQPGPDRAGMHRLLAQSGA